jgi:hypothetical protein
MNLPAVRPRRRLTLRYPDVALYFVDSRLVAFMLTSPGAHTRRGVGIGTPLATAKRRYPELRCGVSGAGFPACNGRVRNGGRYVWFGGDPVENITLSTRAMSGI